MVGYFRQKQQYFRQILQCPTDLPAGHPHLWCGFLSCQFCSLTKFLESCGLVLDMESRASRYELLLWQAFSECSVSGKKKCFKQIPQHPRAVQGEPAKVWVRVFALLGSQIFPSLFSHYRNEKNHTSKRKKFLFFKKKSCLNYSRSSLDTCTCKTGFNTFL